MSSYRWVILIVAVLAQTTASVVSQGIYILVPLLQGAFHLTQASSALAVSAVNAGQVLTMLLMGWFIDKHGERSVVGLTMIAMGVAALCASVTSNYALFLLALVFVGASYASVQPGGTRAILRWFVPAQRGMATGVRQAGLPLGTALAATLLPALALAQGWQTALRAQAIVGIVGGIVFAVFYKGSETRKNGSATPPPNPIQLIRDVSAYKELWPVMIAGIAMVTFQYTFATHVLTFLMKRFGMTVVTAALLYSVSQWAGIAGRIGLAWISDHYWPNRRMRSLVMTMTTCVVATLAMIWLPANTPSWAMTLLFVMVGVFGIGWYPLYLLQVAEMAPKAAMASTVSFSMTLNMAAIAVVPPLFGLVVDQAGFSWAWFGLASVLLLAIANLSRGSARAEAERLARN